MNGLDGSVGVVALEAEMLRYRDKAEIGVRTGEVTDDEADELFGKWAPLMDRIASTPANTLPDLIAKLRCLEWVTEQWPCGYNETQVMARTAREDAERLAEAGVV